MQKKSDLAAIMFRSTNEHIAEIEMIVFLQIEFFLENLIFQKELVN